jgi:excisionase family DNA binding protein
MSTKQHEGPPSDFTKKEFARAINASLRKVDYMIERGEIETYKVGRATRIRHESYSKLRASRRGA